MPNDNTHTPCVHEWRPVGASAYSPWICQKCGVSPSDIATITRTSNTRTPAPLSGITEEMIEDAVTDWDKWDRVSPYERLQLAQKLAALLRQQGPQRSEDQQGAERKWISVDERLPKLGTPIFIRWGDEKASPDASALKDVRVANDRMLDFMKNGKVGWWCYRLVDVPPPFTPTQTEGV